MGSGRNPHHRDFQSNFARTLVSLVAMKWLSLCTFLLTLAVVVSAVMTSSEEESEEAESHASYEVEDALAGSRRHCPLCDSSVYSYCSDKLLHDACCCLSPYDTELPFQCKFADCGFLHANSCNEHHLITSCCCNQVTNA